MNCLEAQNHFADYLEHELEQPDLADLEAHLETCEACREEVESLRCIIGKLDALDPRLSIPSKEDEIPARSPRSRGFGRILIRTAAVLAIGFLLGRMTSSQPKTIEKPANQVIEHSGAPGIHKDWIHLAKAMR